MKKILIAEDNIIIMSLLKLAFREKNCSVIECRNGKEAIEKFNKMPVDIVLSDIEMPQVSGDEFVKYILKNTVKKIPLIIMSSLNANDERIQYIKKQNIQHILKPFMIKDIVNTTCDLLKEQEAAERNTAVL
jgi:CheY-like chemotaxis protein